MALIFIPNLTCTHLYFFDIFHSVHFQPTLGRHGLDYFACEDINSVVEDTSGQFSGAVNSRAICRRDFACYQKSKMIVTGFIHSDTISTKQS